MESILPRLLSFPPHPPPAIPPSDAECDKQLKALVNTLGSLPASSLTGGVQGEGDLLDILDPSINSLPYLHVLLAHIKAPSSKSRNDAMADSFRPKGALWNKMSRFIQAFDPLQIRYSGNEMRRLLELTINGAVQAREPAAALRPIQVALLRIDPWSATLTSTHVDFVALALETRSFEAAIPILDKDIVFYPSPNEKTSTSPCIYSSSNSSAEIVTLKSGLTRVLRYQDCLKYFLYGAMVYMALKRWKRAALFLKIVTSSPTAKNPSKIQVEAYKKLLLVELLLRGRIAVLPKTTSASASKTYQTLSRAYLDFARTFTQGIKSEQDNRKLVAEADFGGSIWQNDLNGGLVAQVVAAYRQFSIQHLQETYAALTVEEIANRTSPKSNDFVETAEYIQSLIARGVLGATITQTTEDPKTWLVSLMRQQGAPVHRVALIPEKSDVLQQIERVQALKKHVKTADSLIMTSKDFVHGTKKSRRAMNTHGQSQAIDSFGMPGDFGEDEDMMADM